MRGAPDWAKTKGQIKKDQTRKKQVSNDNIPLQRLKERESGPPSYSGSNTNLTSEGDNQHEPQAPPLEEKNRYPQTTDHNMHNRGSVYPELSNPEQGHDYSGATTLRARKLSSGDDKGN